MRKAIDGMQKACQDKDEKMFLLFLDAVGVDSDIVDAAQIAQKQNHSLR